MYEDIFRKDGTGYQQERIRGGDADGYGSYEKSDHQDHSYSGMQVLDEILYQIRDDVLGLGSIQSGHHTDGNQSDEHTAAPDDHLQHRREKHQFALGLEGSAGVAGSDKYMGKHDGPSDGAAEGVAKPGAVGHQFIGPRIGEPVVAVLPYGLDRIGKGTVKADDQAGNHNGPENADVDQSLDRIGHNNGFHAADDHVDDNDDPGDQQDILVLYSPSGGDFRGFGNGDQHGCDGWERGA